MVMTKYIQRVDEFVRGLTNNINKGVNFQKWHQYIQQCTGPSLICLISFESS